jgi:hypothetical protein
MIASTESEGVASRDDRDHEGARPEAGKTVLARLIRSAAARLICGG